MTNALEQRQPTIPARISQATAVEQSRAVAEVQAAVFVAQSCPRNTEVAFAEMRAACSRLGLANRAFYDVPNRGGQRPSVHLARELARIWGNLDGGVRELRRDDDAHESEIQAYAWDQQTNVRQTRSFIVPHAKMKAGSRSPLTDLQDIYLNNQNIGARAARECLFAVMPADYVAEAQEICRRTIERGDGNPMDERIANMVTRFADEHVTVAMIEARVGRGRGAWTPKDLADLAIVYSSLTTGQITIEEAFPQAPVTVAEIKSPRGRAKPKPVDDVDDEKTPHEWTRVDLVTRVTELFARCDLTGDDRLAYASDTLLVDVVDLAALTDQQLADLMVALTAYAEQLEPPASAE